MKLQSKFYPGPGSGGAQPILILHGLFGSSKNWVSVAKHLSSQRDVYALDLRNHGDSPHSPTHSLVDMVEDVAEWIRDRNLEKPILLGHSMGGLVSMLYALSAESKGYPPISRLVVQDIVPREYPFEYSKEVESMSQDMSDCKSRSDVDAKMASYVPDAFIRQFLQMNLERNPDGGYYWKINVSAISTSRKMFGDAFSGRDSVDLPSLFLLGAESAYIQSGDEEIILRYFPNAVVKRIEGGGHYIQYTHFQEFIRNLVEWLGQ